jgi:phage terminase small subunit
VTSYIKQGNLIQATRDAGYSEGSIYKQSCRISKREDVALAINELQGVSLRDAIATRDELKQILSDIVRAELEAEIRMNDRLKAADLLSKVSGWYTDDKKGNQQAIQINLNLKGDKITGSV